MPIILCVSNNKVGDIARRFDPVHYCDSTYLSIRE